MPGAKDTPESARKRRTQDRTLSTGEFHIAGQRRGYRDSHRGGHGSVDLRESIARSTATAGGAVVFAGTTVVIALVALCIRRHFLGEKRKLKCLRIVYHRNIVSSTESYGRSLVRCGPVKGMMG